MYCRGAIRAQSLAAPVILSVINVHVILLFQTNKPDDDDVGIEAFPTPTITLLLLLLLLINQSINFISHLFTTIIIQDHKTR